MHPNNPQSPKRLTAAERRAQVWEYKLLGASTRQIADKLGISPTRVHQIICEELTKKSEQTRMSVDQYRQLHLEELDAVRMAIMQTARTGDVFAIDRLIKIQQQCERILPGLALVTKTAVGLGGIDDSGQPSGGTPITVMMTIPRRSFRNVSETTGCRSPLQLSAISSCRPSRTGRRFGRTLGARLALSGRVSNELELQC